MKKKLLFVIESLECAGAEKSLVTLLSLLDYSKYSVDLQLFGYNGALEELLPNEVNLLKPLKYTTFSKKSLFESVKYSIKKFDFRMLVSRIKYSLKIRKKIFSNLQKARIYWQSVSTVIENNPNNYDIAISYAQGVPTFYVAEKVSAMKKYAWVNASVKLDDIEKKFQKIYYDHYTNIIAVSNTAKDIFIDTFPYYSKNVEVIYDINNPNFITWLAENGNENDDVFNGLKILTIGRLTIEKGYDIALEACKKLRDKGINFKWYVLGKGPFINEIYKYIQEYDLSDHFILLGVKTNPYPFIKKSDIYVQTSRDEGFCLAIAEARILNVPVVTTRFDAVYNQMVHEKNGLVVDMNANAVYEGILRLINDEQLRQNIISYLKLEKKGNLEEIQKFYKLIC